MPLKKQRIPIPLATGLRTDIPPQVNQQGTIKTTNARIKELGLLSKRTGQSSIDGPYTTTTPMLGKYKDLPVLFNNTFYVFDTGTDSFSSVDTNIQLCDISMRGVSSASGDSIYCQDFAEGSSVYVVAYVADNLEDGMKGYIKTYDLETNIVIDELSVDVADYSYIRCVATSTYFGVFYFDEDAAISRVKITSAGVIGTPDNIPSSPGKEGFSGYALDVVATSNDVVLISLFTTDDVLLVIALNSSLALTGYNGDISIVNGDSLSMFKWGTAHIGVCWTDYSGTDNTLNIALFTEAPAVYAAAIVAYTIEDFSDRYLAKTYAAQKDSNSIILYTELVNDLLTSPQWKYSVGYFDINVSATPELTVAGYGDFVWGQMLASYPFLDKNGEQYILTNSAILSSSYQNQLTYYLIKRDSDNLPVVIGKMAESKAVLCIPSHIHTITSGIDYWRTLLPTKLDYNTDSLSVFDIDFDIDRKYKKGDETKYHYCIAGSIPQVFDGQNVVEQGFHYYPYAISSTVSTGTGMEPDEDETPTYGYQATYDWTDNQGLLWRSAPSPINSITITGTQGSVSVDVPTYTITQKDNTTVSLWRTVANGDAFHLVETKPNSTSYPPYVTFEDTMADSTLEYNELLYTTGGIIENIVPPSYRVSTIHDNRLFIVNREDENTDIRYTKPFDNKFGVQHSDFFTISMTTAGGKITALRTFIDRLIIFKEDAIYATYGDGLNDFALGNNYAKPSLVFSSLGCIDQHLITEIPEGLMFVAKDNQIYLLSRNLNVEPIGDPVQYYSNNQTFTSCYSDSANTEAVYLCQDAAGYALVYNWQFKVWTQWDNYDAYSAVIANDVRYVLNTSGYVLQHAETYVDTDYEDTQTYVTLSVRSGWYSFSNLAGFNRVRKIFVFGNNLSSHTLNVKIAYDFDNDWTDDFTFDASELTSFYPSDYYGAMTTGSNDQAELIEISGSRQKCTSIMVEISDEDTSGEAGLEIIGLVVEIGLKNRTFPVGTDRVQ